MRRQLQRLQRPLLEFLSVPVLIVVGFVALAELIDWLDNRSGPREGWGPFRLWLSQYVGDTQSAIGVLSAITGSLFTITSITFSILLLAVQQGATVLNSQIVDHYLRRGSNRVWFGFFVGVSLFALITLVQTTHTSAPVLGVTISTLLGAVALLALVVLIYSTIDQTRPATVLGAIADVALAARRRELPLLAASAQGAALEGGVPVVCAASGHLLRVDLAALQAALGADLTGRVSIVRRVGEFVPAGAAVAVMAGAADPERLARAVAAALPIADQRNVADDPGYSLHHIATIGWTAISTARSDPAVGTIAVETLQRLLHAWPEPPARGGAGARLFYEDRLADQWMDTVESLIVAAAESKQHQTLALILVMLGGSLTVLGPGQVAGAARVLSVAAGSLEEHLPTRVLCAAVRRVAGECRSMGCDGAAGALERGLAGMRDRAGLSGR